jgi:hypothetical protein
MSLLILEIGGFFSVVGSESSEEKFSARSFSSSLHRADLVFTDNLA